MIRAASFLILLIAETVAASTPEAGPGMGEEIRVGDSTFRPYAVVDLYLKQEPKPGLYRHVAVKWTDKPSLAGSYPAAAFAARKEGDVFLSLTVAADGKPTACRITRPSGVAALDEHSCGHALAHTIFHPGLDDKGRHLGGTVEGRMSYALRPAMRPSLIEAIGWKAPSRQVEPLQPITLDTLGIPRSVKLPWWIDKIKALLTTDAEGKVTACLLTVPTFDDSLDKGACDRLRMQRFRPALDRERRPAAGLYEVLLPLPR